MNDNVMIFSRSVQDYFNKLNETISTLNARAVPFVIEATRNGNHTVGLTEVSTGGRMTMTSGNATIIRRGEMRDFEDEFKRHIYTAKVVLYLTEHSDPVKLNLKMQQLKYMQNQDYTRILLNGERGNAPLPAQKGTNLKGGLTNYVGSILLEGEIKSVDDVVDFVNDATSNIDEIVDITVGDKEAQGAIKRYTLIMPSSSGVGKTSFNTGHGFETLQKYLLDVYQTDLVVISSGIAKFDKAILIPAKSEYIYFHLDTFNEIYEAKPGGGQFHYEIHWGTAGLIVSNPALIQTKKLKEGKLEGLVNRNARTDVKILNEPLKIKDESKGEGKQEEAPKKGINNLNKTGGN